MSEVLTPASVPANMATDEELAAQAAADAGMFKIDEVVLSGTGTMLDFPNIRQDLRLLKLIGSVRGDNASAFVGLLLGVNADTADASYFRQEINANNQVITTNRYLGAAGSRAFGLFPGGSAAANHWGDFEITLYDYAAANKYKHVKTHSYASWGIGVADMFLRDSTVIRNNTGAIDRVTIYSQLGNFIAGSKASLWGMASPFT